MADVLKQARRNLLERWDLSYISLPTKETSRLLQLWAELKAVETVEAWRCFSALSGQLLEALLRQKLLSGGYYNFADLAGCTLGALIKKGRDVGVLPDFDDPPTGSASVSTALVLRNWASHASLWYDYPTELRATQSLVLAICAVEGLFPRDTPTFTKPPETHTTAWWMTNWQAVAPGTLMSVLGSPDGISLTEACRSDPTALYRHIVRYGTAGSVAKLLELTHDLCLDQDALRHCLEEGFVDLVRNASRSAFGAFLELLWRLRVVGLGVHAKVFAILLPFDAHLFRRLLETRSPAWVARYVTECFQAEPDVFAATASDPAKMGGIVNAFWGRFASASGNILNMANILAHLPYELRILILGRAPADRISAWVASSEPRNSMNLLASMRDEIVRAAPHLQPLREVTVQTLRRRIRQTPPEQLDEIPLRLTRFKLNNDSTGVEVLAEVLEAATVAVAGSPDWRAVQRILWDSYAFYPVFETEAVARAARILADHGPRIPFWSRLCLAGLVDLGHQPRGAFERHEVDEAAFLRNVTDPGLDRWQRFLACLGYWHECTSHDMRFPSEALAELARLHRETRADHPGPSARLLGRIGELLTVHGVVS
jgi:hypothetical protein